MAGNNGTTPTVPTIDSLRRAYEEGLPQTLLSGVEVLMHPLQPEKLLMAGNIPDILTPVVMHMLFAPEDAGEDYRFPDEVEEFIDKSRDDTKERMEFIRAVDTVCQAVLIDPSIVPYLSFSDRLWIFKLAFYPVEVLSTFRLKPRPNVEVAPDEQGHGDTSERADAGDGVAVQAESADRVSV